jgi:hypothetical protein
MTLESLSKEIEEFKEIIEVETIFAQSKEEELENIKIEYEKDLDLILPVLENC